jgi:hypothetical protein
MGTMSPSMRRQGAKSVVKCRSEAFSEMVSANSSCIAAAASLEGEWVSTGLGAGG